MHRKLGKRRQEALCLKLPRGFCCHPFRETSICFGEARKEAFRKGRQQKEASRKGRQQKEASRKERQQKEASRKLDSNAPVAGRASGTR